MASSDHGLEATEGETLTEGWEPAVPASDSLLLAAARNHAHHLDALASAPGWTRPRGSGLAGGASGLPHPIANSVVLTAPATTATGEEGVARAAELARGAGVPLLLMSPWPTPDLQARGFMPVGHPPLMVRFPAPVERPMVAGLGVAAATSAEDVDEFERALVAGYPVPELVGADRSVFSTDAVAAGWRLFTGRVGDEVVATAAGFVADGIQVVSMVSTAGAHRRRGYGEAVTWAAALIDPEQPAMLIASDLGRPVYARMGFLPVCRFTLWVVPPS